MRKGIAALLLLHATSTTKIDIEGVDRALLIVKLYKKACLQSSSPSLSVSDARHYVGNYIKRLHGVAMYINVPHVTESNYLDATVYNEVHGDGLAESVVNKIKMKSQKRSWRCFGFGCDLRGSLTALASICVGATICGVATALGYVSDTVTDLYTNDATENVFVNAEGAEEAYFHAEHDGSAGPDAHASDVNDNIAIGNADSFSQNADLEAAIRKSNDIYEAIVKDVFTSNVEDIDNFHRITGDYISAPDVVAAKSKFVAAIAQHNAGYPDTNIDYELKDALFNSAVDDAIADSNTIDDDIKRFLVDPKMKDVDSATRDAMRIRETLDLIVRRMNVDPSNVSGERDAFIDAIQKSFSASSEAVRTRADLVISLGKAIKGSASVAAAGGALDAGPAPL